MIIIDAFGLEPKIRLSSVYTYGNQVLTFPQNSWVNEVCVPHCLTQMSPASHIPTVPCPSFDFPPPCVQICPSSLIHPSSVPLTEPILHC